MDGTHIVCAAPEDSADLSHNQKGFTSQNCLLCYDFNFQFTYILSGWEGSMADATIFHDVYTTDLAIPDGKYYLVDAGFPICCELLVLYCQQCYHLAEWGCSQNRWAFYFSFTSDNLLYSRPMNPQELYNLCHAKLCNIIKCIIGVLKHCFQILTTSPEYNMNIQAYIPASLACVHNIIHTHDSDEL